MQWSHVGPILLDSRDLESLTVSEGLMPRLTSLMHLAHWAGQLHMANFMEVRSYIHSILKHCMKPLSGSYGAAS